jgi:hypothetical protein
MSVQSRKINRKHSAEYQPATKKKRKENKGRKKKRRKMR